MKDLNTKFIEEVSKIKEPEIFLGVARILKVRLVEDEFGEDGRPQSRCFEDICADVITNFAQSERQRKRELLKILQKANKEVINANRTKNSKESIAHEKVQ